MDTDRPRYPYQPGFVMQVTEHHPPAPFGPGGYPHSRHSYVSESLLEEMSQTQQVLACPPQDTQWPSDTPPRSGILTVTKTISVGEARGAQLVICNVLICGQNELHTAAAKIYDPLYYPARDDLINAPQDVVWMADMDYSREALAYRHLQTTKKWQKSGFSPEYYGSWTFDLALTRQGREHKRSIRLLLIEQLAGSSILDLYTQNSQVPTAGPDAFHYDEAYRLDVLAEMLEGVLKQLHTGLDQRDLSPRNVMLVPSPRETMPPLCVPRVVLIDYNISIVFEHTKYRRHPHQDRSRPTNPAEYFWSGPPLDFHGWAPAKWYHQDRRSYQEWLLARFGGKHAGRFAPIEKKLEFSCNSA
ncbi:hypothetical protein F4801DRAFT_559114 [Xylaria longipes]|nr:hypothetical protein F4801DRAFT_559114 [Xylaria longipes]RYC54059.1 hypothetical protein CHU98_g12150 [Xylaria longipes]